MTFNVHKCKVMHTGWTNKIFIQSTIWMMLNLGIQRKRREGSWLLLIISWWLNTMHMHIQKETEYELSSPAIFTSCWTCTKCWFVYTKSTVLFSGMVSSILITKKTSSFLKGCNIVLRDCFLNWETCVIMTDCEGLGYGQLRNDIIELIYWK